MKKQETTKNRIITNCGGDSFAKQDYLYSCQLLELVKLVQVKLLGNRPSVLTLVPAFEGNGPTHVKTAGSEGITEISHTTQLEKIDNAH